MFWYPKQLNLVLRYNQEHSRVIIRQCYKLGWQLLYKASRLELWAEQERHVYALALYEQRKILDEQIQSASSSRELQSIMQQGVKSYQRLIASMRFLIQHHASLLTPKEGFARITQLALRSLIILDVHDILTPLAYRKVLETIAAFRDGLYYVLQHDGWQQALLRDLIDQLLDLYYRMILPVVDCATYVLDSSHIQHQSRHNQRLVAREQPRAWLLLTAQQSQILQWGRSLTEMVRTRLDEALARLHGLFVRKYVIQPLITAALLKNKTT